MYSNSDYCFIFIYNWYFFPFFVLKSLQSKIVNLLKVFKVKGPKMYLSFWNLIFNYLTHISHNSHLGALQVDVGNDAWASPC